MPRKKELVFYEFAQGKICMDVQQCGISFLCITCDGLPLIRVKGKPHNRRVYIAVDTVIDWYEKEAKENTRANNKTRTEWLQVAAGLRKSLAQLSKNGMTG